MVSVSPSPNIPILTPTQLNYSTARLYRRLSTTAAPLHYGEFASERAHLDYSFHTIPSPTRQVLQDEIIRGVLTRLAPNCTTAPASDDQSWMGCSSDDAWTMTGKPLALFTAGYLLFSSSLFAALRSSFPPIDRAISNAQNIIVEWERARVIP